MILVNTNEMIGSGTWYFGVLGGLIVFLYVSVISILIWLYEVIGSGSWYCGVLGGLLVFLFVCVCWLLCKVEKIKDFIPMGS